MATTRPWITPAQVKAYTDYQRVKDRTDAKLEIDIRRAESKIIEYLNRDFTEIDPATELPYYTDIPQDVLDATIIVAESIALNATSSSRAEGLKSESFDDYSYVRFNSDDWVNTLDISSSLNPYILNAGSGNRVAFSMRKL